MERRRERCSGRKISRRYGRAFPGPSGSGGETCRISIGHPGIFRDQSTLSDSRVDYHFDAYETFVNVSCKLRSNSVCYLLISTENMLKFSIIAWNATVRGSTGTTRTSTPFTS